MQLEHSFTVPVLIDEAWRVLLDIERVAPCMPGAALDSVDGDHFTGTVKVRVGPMSLTYKGEASFVEKDETAHRAVIDARGKDARGAGTAAAKVSATLHDAGESTRVVVVTDLNVTGRPAQFGRGVMADVGNKLIGQFADCLAGKLGAGATEPGAERIGERAGVGTGAGGGAAAEAPVEEAASAGMPAGQRAAAAQPPAEAQRPAEVTPINLVSSVGPAIARRVAPVLILFVLVFLVVRRRRRVAR